MKISIIAGARPNFMKIAPIIEAIKKAKESEKNIDFRLVHTGQHYDEKMSESFFKELGIPAPDTNLEVGSGTQAQQTANIMIRYEEELMKNPCDVVLVVGDVNSTMACSIVAKKLNIQLVHVEAGIRSYDLTMPEEINRMVTDALADHFFTTTTIAGENLIKSGIEANRIHFVGNTMIDTLLKNVGRLRKPNFYDNSNLTKKKYLLLTLHRPSNVDDKDNLEQMLKEISVTSKGMDIVFPVHPRTKNNLDKITDLPKNLILAEPLPYLEFIYLVKNAKAVITDSGGVQEETTVLGVPCMTLRNNTERPETSLVGTNELLGTNVNAIKPAMEKLLSGNWKKGAIPEKWDGNTSDRIVEKLLEIYS
jgi:UDP-N-acetylglucosamine 2-epimerase (non-hydrolysing)